MRRIVPWLARAWPPLLMLLAEALATAPAQADQYVVDGFALGGQVALNGPNYQSYTCKPSEDFADATRCQRAQKRRGTLGELIVSNTLIHARDGTAIYIMANAAPVTLSRAAVQAEIEDLSRGINERPAKVEWLTQGRGSAVRTAVVAIWGQIKLEEVDSDDLRTIADGKNPRLGVLVDSAGDIPFSAQNGFLVYRMVGGPGYLYVASFDVSGRGHRHYVAIDGSQLAAIKFQRELETILQKDRSLANDDYRLWPEVAMVTRRLALDTSPTAANKLLDQIFDKSRSNKLRSHVWSLLPTGAIQRLAQNNYSLLDFYGPKTRHPEIRHSIQSLLVNKPSDPFIEFAHF